MNRGQGSKEQHYFEVYGGSVFGPYQSALAAKRGYCKHVRETGCTQAARFFLRRGGRRVDLTEIVEDAGRTIYSHASRGERGTGEQGAKRMIDARKRQDITLKTLYGSFRCDGCDGMIAYLYDYDGTIGCPDCGTEPSAKQLRLATDNMPTYAGYKADLPVVALDRSNREKGR